MAGVRDEELFSLTGFPLGVNNVAPEQDPPRDENGRPLALREAVNVDLVGPSRKPRLRAGRRRVLAGRCHSPAVLGGHLLLVHDGNLEAYDRDLRLVRTVRAAVGPRYASSAEFNEDLYWSNGLEFRRIRGEDLADLPAWIDCPGVPDAAPHPDGGLPAGTYRIGMTWFDAEGRESGCEGLCEVTVAAGQGIRVFAIPAAPEGAAKARLYLSPPDGDELYAAADLLPAVSQFVLGAAHLNAGGRALETLFLYPLPPLAMLCAWNGLLLGFEGTVLRWSAPLRVGLTHAENYMRFGGATLLQPLGEGEDGAAGVFVADHARTYWMAGGTPTAWRKVIRYDHPAVPGTAVVVKGTDVGLETSQNVAVWLAANGVFVAGLPGGAIQPLTDGRLALPAGEQGAAIFREYAGLRQIVTSFITRGGNALAMGDTASASVTRHAG